MNQKRWTTSEIDFVKAHYQTQSSKWLAEQLQRSESSVKNIIVRSSLKKLNSVTEEDIKFIKENYPKRELKWIAKELNKSVRTIERYAYSENPDLQKFRRWTRGDDEYLRHAWGRHPLKEIIAVLERTPGAIEKRMKDLDISVKNIPGYESVYNACHRTGFNHQQLIKILQQHNVPIRTAPSFGKLGIRKVVKIDAVTQAVKNYLNR